LVSGIVTATTFVGPLSGTATSTTNIPNLTGDISSVNTTTTLATVNSNVGTFGGTGAIPVVTVNGKGLVTGISTVAPNNGTLTLAVSGTGLSGSASFTANQSGASTFTVTSNATSANTNNTIVARDGSGNFSAGTITANLTGTASNVTTNANLTGDVTSIGNATAIATGVIVNADINASAAIAVSKLAASTISGITLGNNLNTLTIGTGLSGSSYNGSSAVTIAIDSTVATLTGTQTLTNKTLTSPTLTTPVLGAATATSINASGAITANSYNVGTDVGISTTRTTVATTAATTIDSFAIATFRSARVQVQITQGTNYQTSDVLIIHNGTTANIVEYGSIATNDYLGTFSSTVSGGNCLLQINMSSATSSTVKVLSQRITV
jgi:trimeric autotransporter adhesin